MATQRELTVQQAWVGDAVLLLFARLRILAEDGAVDQEKCVRMTSNQFLSAIAEPTSVEAEVGRVYEQQGLQAAFGYIEQNIMPMFERQEENRRRKSGRR